MTARRGWREKIEAGLYRSHRTGCPSSADKRPGRRCACPFELQVPGSAPGRSRSVTMTGAVAEARAARRRLLAEGRPAAPVAAVERGTLDEFAGHFFRARSAVLAPSTIAGYEHGYRANVSPALGALDLGDVTRERLEVWIAELSTTRSRHAVWKAHTALRSILKSAVEWERIPSNPATGLRLPKKTPGEDAAAARVLTVEQLAMLLGATGRVRVETMFRVAGEAGLRAGEVVGLRWPSVDLVGRRLTVERSVWQEAGRDGAPPRRIVKGTKSGRSRRVAISATFAARLAGWYAESVVEGGADAAGYVWPGRDGGPMDSSTAGQALARVLRRAGLVDRNGRPLITFHGLRHTAASIMLAHRVPLIVVSRQLGHANPNITAQVYAHLLSDAQLDDAAAVFEAPNTTETMGERMGGIDGE